MKMCWLEGDLRAYLDAELPAESREQVSEHLAGCAACSARVSELSGRAARVSNWMAMLPEAAPVERLPVLTIAPRRERRWTAAALALAAGLAIGFVMIRHAEKLPPLAIQAPAAIAPAAVEMPVESPRRVTAAVAAHRPARRAAARPAVLQADFLRLDDEPLETGTIVRVSAENGDVQADLIVGPDGRAHAIRVIGSR
jgi:anti-sigma factor RsiW